MSNNKQQPKPENPNNQFSNTEPLTHSQRVAIANTMSNNKQSSSIDFFWNQLPEILPFTVDTETAVKLWEVFEQAKAMHKEEHGQTWDKSLDNLKARGMNEMRAYTDFDDYYNETFGE